MPSISRRGFLIGGGLVGGALLLGYALVPKRLALHAPDATRQTWLSTWVAVHPDNSITILAPHAEMGQGVLTSLPMMLAEEMDADWRLVKVRPAPAEGIYVTDKIAQGFEMGEIAVPAALQRLADYAFYRAANAINLQITGGSSSVRFTGQWGMRPAGAAAKAMLIKAAARRWGLATADCHASLSHVLHKASGRKLAFGELAAAAARLPLPSQPTLKRPQDYVLCGRSIPRIDVPTKVNGAQRYGIDLRLNGMCYAAIRHAPALGAELVSMDAAAIKDRPGIRDVLAIPGAAVVTADNYWRASQALDALPLEFSDGEHADFNTESMFQTFAEHLDTGEVEVDYEQGEVQRQLESATRALEAAYQAPFLAHAALEPPNCTAHWHEGRLEVWVGSQDPLGMRALIAETAAIDMEAVQLHPMPIGGAFGRRFASAANFVKDAVHIAKQLSYPVQLIWSREEDMRHDYYRPATISRFAAVLDAQGRPAVWKNHYIDIGANEHRAAAYPPYAIPHQQIGRVVHKTPVPVGYWRSVEHSYQGFFIETFIDELAHHAAADPLAYRLELLKSRPRHQAALKMAAARAGWGKILPQGTALGLAIVESFATIVAQVARVKVGDTVKVEQVVVVADAGELINPAIARAQIESAVIFGLTAALYGNITLAQGRVVQSNFPDYPMLTLADTPAIDVHFITGGGPPGGMGEVGTPPIAAALGNAIFAATGKRIRSLPVARQLDASAIG